MCGIAGAVSGTTRLDCPEHRRDVGTMTAAILHRGPDDTGTWVDPHGAAVFGHCRLAIQDPTPSGHQPMVSSDRRVVVSFNGEIYNHRELRRQLKPVGGFQGNSDTETLVEAVAAWGVPATLRRLRGMFAFAVLDLERRRLTLARDRLGEKPLYHGRANGLFFFASELRALEAHPRFPTTIDRRSVALLAKYNYIPTPLTIYEGAAKLPPGTYLEVDVGADGLAVGRPQTYWSLHGVAARGLASPLELTPDEAEEELHARLRTAVAAQMISDVPLGAFLSGGIDSSTVVAIMQSVSDQPVRTYSIGFEDQAYDEAPHAGAVARHLGTDHTEVYVTAADAQDLVTHLADVFDEPFADSSMLPTTFVSQLARRDVKVALSGDGGDELFGGYPRYDTFERFSRRLGRVPARRQLAHALRALPPSVVKAVYRLAATVKPRYGHRQAQEVLRILTEALLLDGPVQAYDHHVYGRRLVAGIVGGIEDPGNALARLAPPASLTVRELATFLDGVHYLPDDILVKVDRAAMSTSLETRVPMLDPEIVEFAWQLPPEVRFGKPDDGPKPLLRRVLHRYVPPAVVDRPKMGFGVPVGDWISGPLRDWAEDLLSPTTIARDGVYDPHVVQSIWQEHLSGHRGRTPTIWSVLMTTQWLRR